MCTFGQNFHVKVPRKSFCMPSLLLPRFSLQDMSDKKSPPTKEKPFIVRIPQSDDKGMKRKLLSPGSPTNDDFDKKTPNKRKRGSVSLESSAIVSHLNNPKTLGSSLRPVPLSERQQLAMIMRMADESTQGTESTSKPPSPNPLQSLKKSQLDRKVFKRNERGEMQIHLAAIKGDIKNIKKLIKAGADVNVADFAGWTPLHEASNRGWFTVAKHLLKAGANVNVQGLENDTPLHDASINGHKQLVELLLKYGANPLQPNAKGKTPLDVASSAEMVKILKKEVCLASDSSSIEDVRSPQSPYSVISSKDDDEKSLDLEDVNRSHRSELSSSNRRLSIPKSPDGKLSSPRLCLKFQRDNIDHMNRRSRDAREPQYKSYSVTNMSIDSCLDQAIFPAADSPISSVDSDLYNQGFDETDFSDSSSGNNNNSHHVDENSLVSERIVPNLADVHRSVETKRNNDRIPFVSSVYTNSDSQRSVPFKHKLEWSYIKSDDPMDLCNLKTNISVSIPSKIETIPAKASNQCNSITSSYNGDPCHQYHAVVTSTSLFHNTHKRHDNVQECLYSNSDVTHRQEVSQSSVSQGNAGDIGKCKRGSNNSVKCVSNFSEQSNSLNMEKWNICPATSLKVEHSEQSESVQPSSPNLIELEVKYSRPSTPKVPPLKIIIPCKSQSTSMPLDSIDRPKHVVSNGKPALPYVINPSQILGNEADAQGDAKTELKPSNSVPVTSSHPVLHNLITDAPKPNLNGDCLKMHDECNDNNEDNVNIDVEAGIVDIYSVKAQDEKNSDHVSDGDNISDNGGTKDDKKDEPTQRVLRSTVRSHQQVELKTTKQQKQQLLDKLEKSGVADSSSVIDVTVNASKAIIKDDEDSNIPPRKQKIKTTKPDVLHMPRDESENPMPAASMNTLNEKVPNPYKIYFKLRKSIANRRCAYMNIGSLCLNVPLGFKDYLLKTCNYVLQGNTTSTLSIPTLSPPNSVKDKMRDLFVQQEEARYKLRLQHVIEREKLTLTMEQENLRVYGRAACALANHGTPLSVCTILRDQEIYNFTEDQVQMEDKDKKNRTRYNGRQFLSWIQDVEDKYERIKELLILRQKQEADSLYAYQKLEWEWRLKELALCDRNITPDIDQLHVPLVFVLDDFDLLPT